MISVLYVDDEPALLEVAKFFLEQTGEFRVDTNTSAGEAFALLKTARYDAILSDYQMPEMDGITFLKYLRARGDETPFIIFTGRGREEIVIEALNEGADFYLQKGGESNAQFAELAHKIRHAVSRTKTIRALQKSARDYRHLIEHASEAIYVVQDDVLRMVNPSLAEMTGYTEQELLSKPFTVFIHPDDRAFVIERYQRRIRGERVPNRYIFRLYRKDTSLRWVELSVVMITWDERPAVLVFLNDITERKVIEDALRESEERYRQYFRTTLDCVFMTTPDGRWIDFNDTLVRMFGYTSREEVLQIPVPSIYADPGERADFLQEVENAGYVKERPLSFRKRDGTVFDSLITIVPLKSPDGSVKAFIGTFRDITERKKAEQALRESEERYRHIFETFEDLYYETDTNGIITLLSPSLDNLTGWNREELIGNPATILYVNPGERDLLLDILDREGRVRDYELLLKKRDGTQTPVSLSARRIYHTDGTPAGVAGILRDITGRKKAEHALRESEEKFRSLVGYSLEAILVLDLDGRILFANTAAARTIETESPDSLVNRNVMEFVAPESRAEVIRDFSEIARGHDGYLARYTIVSVKGRHMYVESVGKIISYGGKPADLLSLRDVTEQRKRELALRESEETHRILLDQSTDPIFSFYPDGTYRYVNRAFAKGVGKTAGQIIGRKIWDIFDREEADTRFLALSTVFSTGVEKIIEVRVPDPGGDRYYMTTIVPIRDDKRTVVSAICSSKDITERKRAEDALRESEERYRHLIENSRDIIFSLSPRGEFTFVSPAWTPLLGHRVSEVIGRHCTAFIHPDDVPRCRAAFNTVLEENGDNLPALEYRASHADGSWRWHLSKAVPIRDENGRITRFDGIALDITDRKKEEEVLADRLIFQQALIDSIPHPIFIKDATARFVGCNRAYERVFGTTREYLAGRTVLDLEYLPADARRKFQEEDTNVIADATQKSYELPIRYADGEVHMTLYSVDGFRLAGGKPGGLIGMLVDISDRRMMEDTLLKANRKLSLLSGITRHDISNRITVLRGFLALLNPDLPRDKFTEYTRKIDTASRHILTMIQFTKDYEAIGMNDPAWQDMKDIVTRACQQTLPGKVTIVNDLPEGSDIYADPLIVKVFYNLIDNAARYGGENLSEIRFFCETTPNGKIIVCKDNGEGVPDDQKEKIFLRGFGRNTGLGLALSREILDITGITIRETGAPGAGARFELVVPADALRHRTA